MNDLDPDKISEAIGQTKPYSEQRREFVGVNLSRLTNEQIIILSNLVTEEKRDRGIQENK